MFEGSPTIHEELGRMRQADRLAEARERHTAQLAVASPAASEARGGAKLRRVRDAVATAVNGSWHRRPPATPVVHH